MAIQPDQVNPTDAHGGCVAGENGYVLLPRSIAQDNSLSFEARGLLVRLLASGGLAFHPADLVRPPDGLAEIREFIEDLRCRGLVQVNADGQVWA